MQPIRRGAVLLASLTLFALMGAGCNHSAANLESGASTPLNANDTVATVTSPSGDKSTLSQSQFFILLQNYTPNPQSFGAPQASAGRAIMQQMVQGLILEGLAKQEGVPPTDAQVNDQYNSIKIQEEAQSPKPFEDYLAQNQGMTPEQFKDLVIRPQVAQLNLATKGLPPPTDAQVKSYYDQNKAAMYTLPARAHIKRIALADQSDAQQIYDQIKKGGRFEDFVSRSVAKAPVGGDFPQWVPLSSPNPALAPLIKSIAAAKEGDTAPPFAFQGGWWLIKVVEKKSQSVLPLDQVKNIVVTTLLRNQLQTNAANLQTMQQKLHDYQAKAKIEIALPQYSDLQAELQNPKPVPPTPMMGGPAPGATPPGAAPAPRNHP